MLASPAYWLGLLLAVPIYWAPPASRRPWVLAAASAAVLATAAPWVVMGLGAWTALGVPRLRESRPWRWIWGGGLVAMLVVFKAAALLPTQGLVAPLGVSFFTFRLVHYAVETARGTLPPHRTIDVLAWILFFPVFTAGPIARFDTFAASAEPTWRFDDLVAGGTRIVVGLGKRFVLAELLATAGHKGTAGQALLEQLGGMGPAEVWTAAIASFLHLYFDFSGYTDVALGAARLFGLRPEENFDWPLFASSPGDFWRRWHMSLSGWCQRYLFFPLVGATRSALAATVLTFTIMGAWHAFTAPWVLWGLYHGVGVGFSGLALRGARRRGWALPRHLAWVGVPATFLFVASAHAFTMLDGVGGAWDCARVYARLFGLAL